MKLKIIPLKSKEITLTRCGQCPFMEVDTMYGEDHICRIAEELLFVELYSIPDACPLMDKNADKVQNVSYSFVGCESDGTKFKGCETWQL